MALDTLTSDSQADTVVVDARDIAEWIKAIHTYISTYWHAISTGKQTLTLPEAWQSPTPDYSTESAYKALGALAQADAIAYFEDQRDALKPGGGIKDVPGIGRAHALKHHLIGNAAEEYVLYFYVTINELTSREYIQP